MSRKGGPKWSRIVVRAFAAVNLLLVGAGLVLLARYRAILPEDVLLTAPVMAASAVIYDVLAVLILARRPGHTVGRIIAFVGAVLSVSIAAFGLMNFAVARETLSLMGLAWTTLIGDLIWPLWLFVPTSLMVVYFPDGRLPTRRWWPVPAAAFLAIAYLEASQALDPWNGREMPGGIVADNPLALPAAEPLFDFLSPAVPILSSIAIFGAAAAVIFRYRRARGTVRTQMKWLVYAVAMWVALTFVVSNVSGLWQNVMLLLWPATLGLAIGIAILRHGLFDIDVVIRRTLQYALVSGMLAAVYFGVVILLTSVLTAFGAQESPPLVTVVATLAVAALFTPLRRRVQRFIDRRFYRRKYDAAQLLAEFAASARDEADLERVSAELLRVTSAAMQPEHVSLWLKERAGERP